jgi:hypothetical protein
MTPLFFVVIVVFMCAIFLMLVVAASLLAALVFRFAPTLQGSLLALTASDTIRMLRRMPTYPAWWYRRGMIKPPNPILVMLALNPLKRPEYLYIFDPLHRPLFTPNRDEAMKIDFSDRFLLERIVRRVEDNRLDVFVVLAEGGRAIVPKLVGPPPHLRPRFGPGVVPQLATLRPGIAVANVPLRRSVPTGSGR